MLRNKQSARLAQIGSSLTSLGVYEKKQAFTLRMEMKANNGQNAGTGAAFRKLTIVVHILLALIFAALATLNLLTRAGL